MRFDIALTVHEANRTVTRLFFLFHIKLSVQRRNGFPQPLYSDARGEPQIRQRQLSSGSLQLLTHESSYYLTLHNVSY
jgi:hypothetical protein